MRRLNSMSRIKSCQSPLPPFILHGPPEKVCKMMFLLIIESLPYLQVFHVFSRKNRDMSGDISAILGHLGPFFGASNGAVSQVRLICSFRYVDLDGHGHCRQCPLMIQTAGGPRGEATDQGLKLSSNSYRYSYILYIYIFFFFTTHICICLNTYIYIYICVCLCIYICKYVYIDLCIYRYMYI